MEKGVPMSTGDCPAVDRFTGHLQLERDDQPDALCGSRSFSGLATDRLARPGSLG